MRSEIRDDESTELQLAPLLDCMFLLLIFFLLATTMKKIQNELDLMLPQSHAAKEVPEAAGTLVLGIDRAGRFYVDGVAAGRGKVRVALRAARDERRPVRLDADAETPYRQIVEMITLCEWEGVDHVKLNTRRDPDEVP